MGIAILLTKEEMIKLLLIINPLEIRVDPNKVIKVDPILICDGCGKRNCGSGCWLPNRIHKFTIAILSKIKKVASRLEKQNNNRR